MRTGTRVTRRCGRLFSGAAVAWALSISIALSQPVPPTRVIAEWEPAIGTLISWPLGIPRDVVEELARDDTIYVLVTGSSAQNQARNTFFSWGIDPRNVEYIHTFVQTKWTRDWGPHYVFDEQGIAGIADPVFNGYPISGRPVRWMIMIRGSFCPESSNTWAWRLVGWIVLLSSCNGPVRIDDSTRPVSLQCEYAGSGSFPQGFRSATPQFRVIHEKSAG